MATARKTPEKVGTHISKGAHGPVFRASAERLAAGQLLRDRVPRASHAGWKAPTARLDPVEILEESNQGRLPELVPLRYGRMLHSPFTFLRGSAALMAYDLATTPTTGIRVQACGDCHLLNFGLFATPERHLVFDVNDFDETHPAPWEWDLKRLVVSFAIAARENQLSDAAGSSGGHGVRACLSRPPACVCPDEPSRRLVSTHRCGNPHRDGARCQSEKGSGTVSRKSPQKGDRTPLSQNRQGGGPRTPPGRSTADSLPCR